MRALPQFQHLTPPKEGEPIRKEGEQLIVPDHPILPFIEGDGTGPDIWKAAQPVFDAAVEKAYGGKRSIVWFEVLAGEKAFKTLGDWLPEDTLKAFEYYLVGIKGPLTTPVGGGIRSLNVALRQKLDLYACVRPVRYFEGVVTPVKHPEKVNMVVFRENTEDVYAGIEYEAYTSETQRLIALLEHEFGARGKIRFPQSSAIGIKPISEEGSKRLVRAAIRYAIEYNLPSVTLVHKGNIMKFTEGGFRKWGYEVAQEEFREYIVTWEETKGQVPEGKILIQDVIADNFLQQIITRPENFSVIATMNLNGDYISDALAAEVGGIGMAPGGNINYVTGHAIFEATHGTAPKYAGQDKVNPSSVILSGVMMFQYMGWHEAAERIIRGLERTIKQRRVTYDLHRHMVAEGYEATLLKTSEFGQAIIENMD